MSLRIETQIILCFSHAGASLLELELQGLNAFLPKVS